MVKHWFEKIYFCFGKKSFFSIIQFLLYGSIGHSVTETINNFSLYYTISNNKIIIRFDHMWILSLMNRFNIKRILINNLQKVKFVVKKNVYRSSLSLQLFYTGSIFNYITSILYRIIFHWNYLFIQNNYCVITVILPDKLPRPGVMCYKLLFFSKEVLNFQIYIFFI